jgi:hypothetical protein
MKQTLIIGELNDGIEPEFPGTDIPRLSQYVQVIFGQELDRQLSEQLPDWETFQGDAENPDVSALGMAIKPGLMEIESVKWTRLGTWAIPSRGVGVLVVRANFQGCPLSLFTTKRPANAHAENRPTFDRNLGKVLRSEQNLSRRVLGGLDANEANSPALQSATRCVWTPPFSTSIVGFLTSHVEILGVAGLPADGEHPPTVGLVQVTS